MFEFSILYGIFIAIFYIASIVVIIPEPPESKSSALSEIIPLLTGGVAAISIPMSVFCFLLAWRAPADQGFTFLGASIFTAGALAVSLFPVLVSAIWKALTVSDR